MASKKKTCTCGKVINYDEVCSCKESRNAYQREYYAKHKDANKELRTARWAKKRQFIISRDRNYCQRCFYKYGIIESHKLQVHHIKPRSLYAHLMYEDSNLITLCKTCNLQLGTQETLDFDWNPTDRDYNI